MLIFGALAHDGWQHHSGYHTIINDAAMGIHAMVLAGTVAPSGGPLMWRSEHKPEFNPLIHPSPRTRALAMVVVATQAHKMARDLANQRGTA